MISCQVGIDMPLLSLLTLLYLFGNVNRIYRFFKRDSFYAMTLFDQLIQEVNIQSRNFSKRLG